MHKTYKKISLAILFVTVLVLLYAFYLYDKKIDGVFYEKVDKIVSLEVFDVAENSLVVEDELDLNTLLDPKIGSGSFEWRYSGKDYAINIGLDNDLYYKYKNSAKIYTYRGSLSVNWREEYYGMFLNLDENDNAASIVVEKLKKIAEDENLSDDQLVELLVAFVQDINYDKAKEKQILNQDAEIKEGETADYPYETLYTQSGICSDKSFLLILLLRELGYGAAMFDYPDVKHTAVGIACPQEYDVYSSGYCYIETTNFFPIGIVPQSVSNDGIANEAKLDSLKGRFDDVFSTDRLGAVDILVQTDGRLYNGIQLVHSKIDRIKRLEEVIDPAKDGADKIEKQLRGVQEDLNELKIKLDGYKSSGDEKTYADFLPKYNKAVNSYNSLADVLKVKVKLLNENINEYNDLIREFADVD